MINLNTPTGQLMKELFADLERTEYWLRKKCGGEKGYTKMRNRLLLLARRNRQDETSEFYEYRSTNGNRWLTFECARYDKDTGLTFSKSYAFCFYETIGGIGAFVPIRFGVSDDEADNGCLIFTSHFFNRLAERTDLSSFDQVLLEQFIKAIPLLVLNFYKEGKIEKVDCGIPGGVGIGVKKKGEEWVFEIRTFLKDSQLSNKQQKRTEDLRNSALRELYAPDEVRIERVFNSENWEEAVSKELNEMKAYYVQQGVDETFFKNIVKIRLWQAYVWLEMGFGDMMEGAFWQRYSKLNGNIIREFAKKEITVDKFIDVLELCAKNLNLKPFNRAKAIEIVKGY